MDAGVGGQLQGISLDSFLQMVQMEKTTCTLKVISGKKEGTLFVLKGDLISAETKDMQNLEAACAIISWEDALIEIENTCSKTKNEIQQPLMHVLMEGLKLKDEKAAEEPDVGQEATVPSDRPLAEQEERDSAAGRDISKDGEEFELHVAPKQKGGVSKVPIIAGILIVAAVAAYFTLLNPSSQNLGQVYQDTLSKVELSDDIDDQVALLQDFINSAGDENEWADTARLKIAEFKEMRENAAYLETSSQAKDLVKSKEYLQARVLYEKHLRGFPDSPNTAQVRAEISNLAALAEKADFEAVTAATKSGDISRIEAFRTYIKNHPGGKQVKSIETLINEMEDEYFSYTEKQIAKSALVEDWGNCTTLVSKYSDNYPAGSNAKKLKKYVPLFEKNRLEYADYEKIMAKAHDAGTDYSTSQKILADYLKSFPTTHLAEKIKDQVARYKKMDEETKINARTAEIESLLLKTQGRFVSRNDGTFVDTHTGLMWCTLDSRSVLDSCLNYESATAHISALKTGGHGDWRLPTPGELKALFKNKPFFPATDASWLWTSKILKKYVGEWLIDVTVVPMDNNPSSAEIIKDSRYCGNVRAVRRPAR